MKNVIKNLFHAQEEYDAAVYEFIKNFKESVDKKRFLSTHGYLNLDFFTFVKQISSFSKNKIVFHSTMGYPKLEFEVDAVCRNSKNDKNFNFSFYFSFEDIDFDVYENISWEQDAAPYIIEFDGDKLLNCFFEYIKP